jgi:hypothetical protein
MCQTKIQIESRTSNAIRNQYDPTSVETAITGMFVGMTSIAQQHYRNGFVTLALRAGRLLYKKHNHKI